MGWGWSLPWIGRVCQKTFKVEQWCVDMAFSKPVESGRNLFDSLDLSLKLLFSIEIWDQERACPLSLALGKKCHSDMFQTNLIVAKLLVRQKLDSNIQASRRFVFFVLSTHLFLHFFLSI